MFSINGFQLEVRPELGNIYKDNDKVYVFETEDDAIYTHIVPGTPSREFVIDIPEDVLQDILDTIDQSGTIIFDQATHTGTIVIDPLVNSSEFVWRTRVTIYEDN